MNPMVMATFAGIGFIFAVILSVVLQVGCIVITWNFLMPTLFGISKLTILQSFALWVLTKTLFGNMTMNNVVDKKE